MSEAWGKMLYSTLVPSCVRHVYVGRRKSQLVSRRKQHQIHCSVSVSASTLQRCLNESGLPPQKMGIERVDVPPSLVISPYSEWSCSEAGEILKRNSVPDWPLLATFLISEAGLMKSSRWSNYISALPRQPYSLLHWLQAELDRYLEASQIREKAIERINNVIGTYNDLKLRIFSKYPDLFSDEVFNIESFKWSFDILFSRLVRLPSMDGKVVLVPWADTLNHSCDVSCYPKTKTNTPVQKKGALQICHSSKKESEVGGNGNGRDWTTSILLFLLWVALMYYVFFLTPNQTPSRDLYFLKKLLNLKGDDGFRMNEVLVSLWYIMGLWPLVYSMLLLPTGRSTKNSIPVWPFLMLSCIGGAYALLPYFVLWQPPAPPVEETQLKTWPLRFLESKVTATISLAAGVAIITYAGLAGQAVWKEFFQYFRESKFIHITSIDFIILSTFAPFWVYNDMSTRKWFDKGSWLLPISLIPFFGPCLYLLLRPTLSSVAISQTPVEPE